METSIKSFAGSSPGQSLEQLVQHISLDNLGVVLGKDVLELVDALTGQSDKQAIVRRIAVTFLRDQADETMVRPEVRAICLDAISKDKLIELTKRMGSSSEEALRGLDPSLDEETWRSFLGFFGIDARAAVPFAAALDRETVRSDFGLFPHQRKAADSILNAIRGGHGRVVLHMPTGAGKTRTAMHVVSRFLGTMESCVVIWLANSAELLDQAADAFKVAWAHLGNRDVGLLRLWGDHAPDLSAFSDGLVIAGLQKMHAFNTKDPIGILRLARSVALVVVDEAHQSIAPTYREVIETLSETGAHNALVGLTATPGRTWSDISADERLSEFFHGRKVMLEVEGWDDPVSYLMAEGYLARPTFHRLEVKASSELKPRLKAEAGKGDDYATILLDNLSDQVDRNIAIIDEARRLIAAGHKRILLFGASVRHAEVLAAAFSALGIDSRVVTGKSAASARERAIKAFRKSSSTPIILCNFGVLTTGFDAPNTSAAIIARPTRSLVLFSQMVGRATRGPKAGGNETCEISTVVDIDLPGFGDVADAFTNWEDVWHDPS
ncbi:MAG: DEAD/DEAH box helicase [Magnetococcales bacterium]|nr:DEAD/DEAH box helicase [Magnetococcales bacterium]